MTTISVAAPPTTASVETLISALLERFEASRLERPMLMKPMRVPMQVHSLIFFTIYGNCNGETS